LILLIVPVMISLMPQRRDLQEIEALGPEEEEEKNEEAPAWD